MAGGQVISQAQLGAGLNSTSVIAMFAVLWACNHYFQSFGALSIVKINAAWFRVTERGKFAGIFGIMIQRANARDGALPALLLVVPWQYAFFVPALLLTVIWGFATF